MSALLARVSPQKIGWEAYIHLVYLGFLFFQPFFDSGLGVLEWLGTFGLIAVFLPIYLTNYTRRGRGALVGVLAIALLGVVGMFFNTGASAFFIYAAAGAAFAVRPRQAVTVILTVVGLVVIAFAFSSIPLPERYWAFFAPLVFAPIIGTVNIFEAERDRNRARLRLAHEEIEHLATIAERERIARDLHDLLGHTLSVITLKSELASKLAVRDAARAETEMAEVAFVSRQALKEVREAVRGYRLRSLAGELTVAKEVLGAAGVAFEHLVQPLQLPPAQESTLALALREAVTNVVRHASAATCTVKLVQDGAVLKLSVEDDGVGKQNRDGAGLAGMRERAELLGGQLGVTRASKGTRLELTLPLAPTKAEVGAEAATATPVAPGEVSARVLAKPQLEQA